jgi:pimeloyl-ACP methyl ester carboxylesterase
MIRIGRRRLAAAGMLLAAPRLARATGQRPYVLVHGAWHGGWAWARVLPLLRAAGHAATAPTLSGLGERAHHAPGAAGLEVHVADILAHLQAEDLRNAVVVAHSYAGCVLSGVLAREPDRISHAVYLDAFVPGRGEALASFVPPPVRAEYEALAAQRALVPPPPVASWAERWGMTDDALRDWAAARITPQAALSFAEPVLGDPSAARVRRSFLKCAANPNPAFQAQARRVRAAPDFGYVEIDAHHNAMLTRPDLLSTALLAIG